MMPEVLKTVIKIHESGLDEVAKCLEPVYLE